MSWLREDVDERVQRAVLVAAEREVTLNRSDSLVLTLGFDSLRIASLAIAIEEGLERPVLLNDWIAACTDPTHLTVGSLCDFVWTSLNGER